MNSVKSSSQNLASAEHCPLTPGGGTIPEEAFVCWLSWHLGTISHILWSILGKKQSIPHESVNLVFPRWVPSWSWWAKCSSIFLFKSTLRGGGGGGAASVSSFSAGLRSSSESSGLSDRMSSGKEGSHFTDLKEISLAALSAMPFTVASMNPLHVDQDRVWEQPVCGWNCS